MSDERETSMIVIKTLNAEGHSPIQRAPWPLPAQEVDGSWTPGEWMMSAHVADGRTVINTKAVNACRPMVYGALRDQVTEWVAARAWIMELDDAVVGATKVGGSRGRLLRPVEGWTRDVLARWACWCVDRAIHVHAVAALRSAGLTEVADQLDAMPPIVDETSARAAGDAARAAGDAAWAAGAAARAAAWAAGAARAARAAGDAAWAAGAARAAGDAAWAAAWDARAAGDAGDAGDAERRVLSVRLCEMAGVDI